MFIWIIKLEFMTFGENRLENYLGNKQVKLLGLRKFHEKWILDNHKYLSIGDKINSLFLLANEIVLINTPKNFQRVRLVYFFIQVSRELQIFTCLELGQKIGLLPLLLKELGDT